MFRRRVRDREPSLPPSQGRRSATARLLQRRAGGVPGAAAAAPAAPQPGAAGSGSQGPGASGAEAAGQGGGQGQGGGVHRPGAKPRAYHETPLLSVGKQVRVKAPGRSRRALIECVNEGEGTVDVMYCGMDDGSDQRCSEEEGTVPAAAISPLEGFEICEDAARDEAFAKDLYEAAAATKEDANVLFKLQDYESAALLYGRAVDELRQFRAPGAGLECWVLMNQGGALVLGSVRSCDAEKEAAEVALYRPDVDQLQVYPAVPWRVLIPVHETHLVLHSSLYTNRAKSLAQIGCHQEAAQDLTVTIGLWAARDEGARRGGGRLARPLTDAEVAEQHEQLTRAYYLRAKTRLARMKLGAARGDLAEARALEPPRAMAGLLQQLERDIGAAQKEQTRSNKRIAKEVAKWADVAMAGLEQHGRGLISL